MKTIKLLYIIKTLKKGYNEYPTSKMFRCTVASIYQRFVIVENLIYVVNF